MAALFKKYGDEFHFPWLFVAAEAFQESGLDHSIRSRAGAVGVMQVMPATAARPPVSVLDIYKLDNNIRAGVKLLKYIRDDYFKDDPMDPVNRTLMTLAAYNAGPARIRQCRNVAAALGLNPNLWFKNVEYAVAKRVGAETVNYVSNIYKYYLGYQLQMERQALRSAGRKTTPPNATRH
jgi:membrane-bound lytic murein transglycosylase MltF